MQKAIGEFQILLKLAADVIGDIQGSIIRNVSLEDT